MGGWGLRHTVEHVSLQLLFEGVALGHEEATQCTPASSNACASQS